MIATRRGSFASGSSRSAFGIASSIVSPDFHARVSSTYDPGPATCDPGRGIDDAGLGTDDAGLGTCDPGPMAASPLILTTNPSPAHFGRRTATVNVFGAASVSVSFAVSPSGKLVSIATFTPSALQSAVDGA